MTAQQALRRYVDSLNDEEAEAVWQWLQRSIEFQPLTEQERRRAAGSREQAQRGETIPHREVLERLAARGLLPPND